MIRFLLLVTAALLPVAARAEDNAANTVTVTAERPGITARQRAVPPQLSPALRASYRQIFLDIDAGRYRKAESALDAVGAGLLTEAARAQLILGRGAGRTTRAEMVAWLAANPDLPQAPRLIAIAQRMPATDSSPLPALPQQRLFRAISYRSSDPLPASDSSAIAALKPLVSANRNAEAEARWRAASLSPAVRTEWAQRIAWSYYSQNDNANARRLGMEAAQGLGDYAALGAWTAGLAAFRASDCEAASAAFDLAASKFPPKEIEAAAHFWANRAHLACGRPEAATERLGRAVAAAPNGFYGLLARRALGLAPVQDWAEPDFITADWNTLSKLPGAKRAAALAEIGQIGLADRELRYLAVTAEPGTFAPLLRLAARLNLPATQYQLAARPPIGLEAPLSARFPAPEWQPARGWRVDRGLVFSFALQESSFVTNVTSRAGARGVMQLMPATAQIVARQMGPDGPVRDLADPSFNIECGQTYLEMLRDMSHTGGLLPKIVAAYNAGPGSVQRWNDSVDDRGDPLLFIESIPFKETRHYVEAVIRNYWMYQARDGVTPPSMDALLTGLWPKMPGMPGATAIKLAPHAVQAAPVGAPPPTLPLAPLDPDATVIASTGK